jgi:hypothetical protein
MLLLNSREHGGKMSAKDQRSEPTGRTIETGASLKSIERFFRILVWQMFFLLAILSYLIMRPQAGRFQFVFNQEGAFVLDTATAQATLFPMSKQEGGPLIGEAGKSAPALSSPGSGQ